MIVTEEGEEGVGLPTICSCLSPNLYPAINVSKSAPHIATIHLLLIIIIIVVVVQQFLGR